MCRASKSQRQGVGTGPLTFPQWICTCSGSRSHLCLQRGDRPAPWDSTDVSTLDAVYCHFYWLSIAVTLLTPHKSCPLFLHSLSIAPDFITAWTPSTLYPLLIHSWILLSYRVTAECYFFKLFPSLFLLDHLPIKPKIYYCLSLKLFNIFSHEIPKSYDFPSLVMYVSPVGLINHFCSPKSFSILFCKNFPLLASSFIDSVPSQDLLQLASLVCPPWVPQPALADPSGAPQSPQPPSSDGCF